jgi:hypothetical protein
MWCRAHHPVIELATRERTRRQRGHSKVSLIYLAFVAWPGGSGSIFWPLAFIVGARLYCQAIEPHYMAAYLCQATSRRSSLHKRVPCG